MPLRLLNLMAQHDAAVSKAVIAKNEEEFWVEIEASTVRSNLIAEKMRGLIQVRSVDLVGT